MISFVTPGELDLRAISIMGVHVKETENPIGYFGTGLKYALAVLLRTEHKVSLRTAGQHIEFTTQVQTIRGKSFNQIYMNDTPLGFTTDLGKNWEVWMALRELYTNTLDEKGTVVDGCADGDTVLTVDGVQIDREWANRHEYFLMDRKPFMVHKNLEVFNGKANGLFYRGICVAKLRKPSMFTYNYTGNLRLTEDRTADEYSFRTAVGMAAVCSHNKEFILTATTATDDFFESLCMMSWWGVSDEFIAIGHQHRHRFLPQALESWKRATMKDTFEEIEPSPFEQKVISKAEDFLQVLGYDISKYKVCLAADLGTDVLGKAHNSSIWLSKRGVAQGTKQTAATILEEFFHLEHGFLDGARDFQTFLFDQIITAGEHIKGEPI